MYFEKAHIFCQTEIKNIFYVSPMGTNRDANSTFSKVRFFSHKHLNKCELQLHLIIHGQYLSCSGELLFLFFLVHKFICNV